MNRKGIYMTDEQMKQRFLELGYEEEQIDELIKDTNIWSGVLGRCDNFFGRIFGLKYDDEEALRELIENWDALTIVEAINEDRARDPEDYEKIKKKLEDLKAKGHVFPELECCSWGRRGISQESWDEIFESSLKDIERCREREEIRKKEKKMRRERILEKKRRWE